MCSIVFSDGFIYERAAIHEWLVSRRQTSPMTNLAVENTDLLPEEELRKAIQEFLSSLNWELGAFVVTST